MQLKWLLRLFSLSMVVSSIFYLLDYYNLEEYGGLSHIGLTGLLLFLPFFNASYTKNCQSYLAIYSLTVFFPIVALKFDIITLLIILLYAVFLIFTICNKLKRREVEE
ncbi:MAG: hypothetical protein ABWJ98_06880 [Hydrogenothermaceae bacterium]